MNKKIGNILNKLKENNSINKIDIAQIQSYIIDLESTSFFNFVCITLIALLILAIYFGLKLVIIGFKLGIC